MRLFYICLVLLAALPARAWDAAKLHDVRFSQNGRYFSFVEYGENDGSGAGYSTFYLIDTATDTWVEGTPIRAEMPEGVGEQVALKEVLAKIGIFLRTKGLLRGGFPVVRMVNPDMPDLSQKSVEVTLPEYGKVTLALEQKQALSAKDCDQDMPVGTDFRLIATGDKGTTLLADFKGALPPTRGCAQGYGISEVFAHRNKRQTVIAVVLEVYLRGWEGYDRRLMAVTRQLP